MSGSVTPVLPTAPMSETDRGPAGAPHHCTLGATSVWFAALMFGQIG